MPFRNSVVGGVTLVRPAIKSPNYSTGSAGWAINADGTAEFNAVTIRGGTIVGGTALYYDGAPGPGTLIMSISATAGTDPYGNAYTAGVGVYGTSDAVTVQSTAGDTAVLTADAPSGIADPTGPGLVLQKASGDAEGASLTEWDDGFQRGIYLRSPSAVADPSALEGVDYGAMRMTGLYYGADPEIQLKAGDPVDAPNGGIYLNSTFVDASGEMLTYASDTFHTYTPLFANVGGATTSTQTGWYLRVGKMIFVNAHAVFNGAGAGVGIVGIRMPTDVDRTTRQVLTCHCETVSMQGVGATTTRGGEAVALTSGSGNLLDRIRLDDSDGDGEANLQARDLVVGSVVTVQGWYREA